MYEPHAKDIFDELTGFCSHGRYGDNEQRYGENGIHGSSEVDDSNSRYTAAVFRLLTVVILTRSKGSEPAAL